VLLSQGGHWLSIIITTPVYYFGFLLYFVAYPLIVVAQYLGSITSWLIWLISLFPKFFFIILSSLLYTLWWLLTLVPYIILSVSLWLIGEVGQGIALLFFLLTMSASLLGITALIGRGSGALLTMVMAAGIGFIAVWGLKVSMAAVLCPVQFAYGTVIGLSDSTVYLQAAITLQYVNVA